MYPVVLRYNLHYRPAFKEYPSLSAERNPIAPRAPQKQGWNPLVLLTKSLDPARAYYPRYFITPSSLEALPRNEAILQSRALYIRAYQHTIIQRNRPIVFYIWFRRSQCRVLTLKNL
ncbi:hypothetical protein TCAL_16234 [Tigriopus californicus]|uniref:Uncharacterized protein n=1 Tax=Tigriopus californicus TaxID=6832 RepID=A0A553P510_TIGCA|nr:hypothetical protein TCAL_16234 [Tigriopus californicus]